jgi:thiol-disulfide isomerase/thioredoxin
MAKQILCSVAALLTWAALGASGKELNVGDLAPKLDVKEFVKGTPVKDLEKGKIYVVEFWATWCGPCKATIPHLTKLQKKHKDVTFIGVSVYEEDPKGVKPFVDEMNEKMDYRVAMDAVPEGAGPRDGKMAKNWLDAAEQEGIPTAFIVNADGKVAWIGHPAAMDAPLNQILNGTWDLKVAGATFKKERLEKRQLRELSVKINDANKSGDKKALLAVLDQGIAAHAKLESQLGLMKFKTLVALGDSQDKTLDYGRHLIEDVVKGNPEGLIFVAWLIVNPEAKKKPEPRFVKLALQAAERADEVTERKEPGVADTLARAYFLSGNAAKALETQERAIKLAKGSPLEDDQGLKDRLAEYQKAAKKAN